MHCNIESKLNQDVYQRNTAESVPTNQKGRVAMKHDIVGKNVSSFKFARKQTADLVQGHFQETQSC